MSTCEFVVFSEVCSA